MDGDLNGTWMSRDRKASLHLSTLDLGKGLAVVRCETDEGAEVEVGTQEQVPCGFHGPSWLLGKSLLNLIVTCR